MSRFYITLLAIVGALFLGGAQSRVWAEPGSRPWLDVKLPKAGDFCDGQCAVHVYGGRETTTGMTAMFAMDNVATFAPDKYVAPWDWHFRDTGLVAIAMSRRLATLLSVVDFEAEIGLAQRFGRMDETELWSALFVRWTWFPWNDYLRTTIATSTGLNYATGIPWDERTRDSQRHGSNLLHFFSPELTLALPSEPDWEFVARIHHRSGGRILFGEVPLFNGVDGGAHFATLGLRHRF